MLNTKIGYSYNDLTIVPAEISHVSSRSECNPFAINNLLPIFTAPMASVVDINNSEIFLNNGIIPIIPRNIDINTRIKLMNDQHWVALSLNEFKDLFINKYEERINLCVSFRTTYFICVDIANGHMHSLYNMCRDAKVLANKYNYKLTIMTGNIANPDTYEWIIKFNNENNIKIIDYIRVGIGGGSGCITTSNVSAHYPQASLIDECYKIKKYWKNYTSKEIVPYIIADGGIRNYDHVIKALALGADYVMIGSVFAQCIESAGIKINKNVNQKTLIKFPIEHYENFRIDSKGNVHGYYKESYLLHLLEPWTKELNTAELTYGSTSKEFIDVLKKHTERKNSLNEEKYIGPIDVKFFGMASADGQKSIDGEKKKTAEGITKYLPVKYTLAGWVENMISYLRSAMSYCDCKNLDAFIGRPELIVNSISEIQAVNK